MAYGKSEMGKDTREVLLYGQLQEGLHYETIKSPAVSGATSYKELCTAAQNEEKQLMGLKKRQNYAKGSSSDTEDRTRHVTVPFHALMCIRIIIAHLQTLQTNGAICVVK